MKEKRKSRRALWFCAAVVVLAAAALGGILLLSGGGSVAAAEAYEPEGTASYEGKALNEDYLTAIRGFSASAGAALLDGSDTTAYSPTALYTALSMVAELADGESLDALLNVLEAENTAALRESSGDLWRYLCANPDTKKPGKVTIANSLWLNQNYVFNGETLQMLADAYYVSSYTGDMVQDIPELVSAWVKKQTNDLLDCRIEPRDDTMAVLLSAIYFYDEWAEPFSEWNTISGSFWGTEDVRVNCNYMERTQSDWAYYQAEGVTASVQYFQNGGKMLFILPDENQTPADVLENTELLEKLLNWETLDKSTGKVEWMIPRFTLKKTLDLEEGLTALGLGDLFDSSTNSLPLLSGDGTPAYIGHAEQGTAISIDEVGCEAASYVEIEMAEGAALAPEDLIELYLTRPFVFAILSENDVPLFLGVVCNPNGE